MKYIEWIIFTETWDAIQFARKEQVKDGKKTHLSKAHTLLSPEETSWRYNFGIELIHVSGFGVGAGVTLLFVRFLERGGDKCRDREAFGWDAGYVSGADVTSSS